jgi:hypothetical protein
MYKILNSHKIISTYEEVQQDTGYEINVQKSIIFIFSNNEKSKDKFKELYSYII